MRMYDEALIVASVLAEFGAPCYVVRSSSYRTARHNVYGLQRREGVKVANVSKLVDEIDEALTDALGRLVRVRFLRGPLAIAIPRADPDAVPMRKLLPAVPRAEPGTLPAMFGEYYDHAALARGASVQSVPLAIDLEDPMTPHVLIGGGTGAGKTVVLKNLIFSLAKGVSPDNMAMILIDPKGRDFSTLWDLPHLGHEIVTDYRQFVPVLDALVGEMDRRTAIFDKLQAETNPARAIELLPQYAGQKLVVVVDELADLIASAGKAAEQAIQRLTQMGRGLGIHVILGTQKPEASFIGGITLGNVPVRACGVVAQMEHGKFVTGMKGSELNAHRLLGKGDFLLTLNGSRMLPFQSGFVTPDEDMQLVQKLREWWKGVRTPFRLDLSVNDNSAPAEYEAAAPLAGSGPAMTRDVIDQVHDSMVDRILQEFENAGSWPSGYKVQQLHKDAFGRQLNPKTAQKLLAVAQHEREVML